MDVARLPTTPSRGRRNSVALRMYVRALLASPWTRLVVLGGPPRPAARARGFPFERLPRPRALELPRTSGEAEERRHSRSDKAPIVLR
jgi:hypothetical protein